MRIDDIEVEDITSAFNRTMMDWVDVRDFGAVGDGVTDDQPVAVYPDKLVHRVVCVRRLQAGLEDLEHGLSTPHVPVAHQRLPIENPHPSTP